MLIRLYLPVGTGLPSDGFSQRFQSLLKDQLIGIGLEPSTVPIVLTDPPAWPERTIHLYLASSILNVDSPAPLQACELPSAEALEAFNRRGHLILPVLRQAEDAGTELPPVLQPYNAFLCKPLGDKSVQCLVAEVLSFLCLHRRRKRVFISYRRLDSAAIAQQLFDAFTHLGYEVFLDTIALESGIHFQQSLFWWLNDADLVILLLSPRLAESRWVQEEIQFAQRHTIGLLGVIWPEAYFSAHAAPPGTHTAHTFTAKGLQSVLEKDLRLELNATDLEGDTSDLSKQTLQPSRLNEVLMLAHERRVRAVVRRLEALVPLARERYAREGSSVVPLPRVLGELEVTSAAGRRLVRVLPFRPTPASLLDLRDRVYGETAPVHEATCFYQEVEARPGRVAAELQGLEWLLGSQLRRLRSGQLGPEGIHFTLEPHLQPPPPSPLQTSSASPETEGTTP